MLYTIVKKCSSLDDDPDAASDINLHELMEGDPKNSADQQKLKKRLLIKGKI